MKLVRALGVLALTGAVAPAAHAVPTDGTPVDVCLVFGGFNSCASVSVTAVGGVLTATVTNSGGTAEYLLPSFGFFYVGSSPGITALTLDPDPQTDGGNTWEDELGFGLENPGPTGGTWLGGAQASGPGDRLGTGESITLTFSYTGDLTGDIFFGFRGQAWLGDGSFKCYEGAPNSEPSGALCEPPTVVPEPATMALLATGLVGLGGAGAIRRRRQQKQS